MTINRYGAGEVPRVDPPNPLEQPAPLRTIGPVRAVTTPLGDTVSAPFSVGMDTGCANAALRVTGGGHFTQRVGIGVCPSSTNAGLQVSGPSGTLVRLSATSGSGPVLYITPFSDSDDILRLSNAADSVTRHFFNGAGNAFLSQGFAGALAIGTTGVIGSRLNVWDNASSTIAAFSLTGSTNNPRLAILLNEAAARVTLDASGSAGAPFFRFQTGGVDKADLTSTVFGPTSSAGLTLGTSSLPWGGLFLRTSGGDETVRLQAFGATSAPYFAFFNSSGSRNGFWQVDYNNNGSQYFATENTTSYIAWYTNGVQRWQIQTSTSGSHFVPAADNTYNIGASSLRISQFYVRNIQLTDDVTSGNPYIQWTWKNSGGTGRAGYLEATANVVRFYSTTLGTAVLNMDYVNGDVTVQNGHLLFGTDDAKDIGATGATRPKNVYVSQGVGARHINITAAGTGANTAQVDLMSHTLPTLVSGDTVEIWASGTITGTNNTKTVNLQVASSGLAAFTAAAGTTGDWFFHASITKDGSNIHYTVFQSTAALTGIAIVNAHNVAQELSATAIKVTASTPNSGDEVTQERFVVTINKI